MNAFTVVNLVAGIGMIIILYINPHKSLRVKLTGTMFVIGNFALALFAFLNEWTKIMMKNYNIDTADINYAIYLVYKCMKEYIIFFYIIYRQIGIFIDIYNITHFLKISK